VHEGWCTNSFDMYVDYTGKPVVGYTGEPREAWDYARIPWEVACDRRLKPLDVRVYCIISGPTFQGTTSQVGQRLIANLIHAARVSVVESLRRLECCGHIKRAVRKRGRREMYLMTSKVFGKKQRAGHEEIISSPSGTPRLASVRDSAKFRSNPPQGS
jgi:hypothetical protein